MDKATREIDILYVEDDEVDIQGMQREFKKVNPLLKIDVATTADEALNKLYGDEPIKPKIILLDINLGKVSGTDFLKKLRSDSSFSDVQVFILTGSYSTKDKLAMEDLHVRGHIIKPIQYSDALNVFWTLQS